MQEALRQQYLEALGVPNLVPRFELAGARPSDPLPVATLVAIDEGDRLSQPESESPSAAAPMSASTPLHYADDHADDRSNVIDAGLMAEYEAQASQSYPAAATPSVGTVARSVATVLAESQVVQTVASQRPGTAPSLQGQDLAVGRFRLAMVKVVGLGILIVDTIPDRHVFSKPQQQFINELLLAFGLRARLDVELVAWPLKLPGQVVAEASPEAARQMLSGYLQRQQGLTPVTTVVALGQVAGVFFAPKGAYSVVAADRRCFHAPVCTAEAMMEPLRKYDLWLALQGLGANREQG